MKEKWENSSIVKREDVIDCGWCTQDHYGLNFRTDGAEILARCPISGGLIADTQGRNIEELLNK